MPSYPTIDYLGAAQGIIRNIDDFERLKIARAAEESNSQYRDMLMKEHQNKMDQEKRLDTSLSNYFTQSQTNPDFQPTMGQRTVQDYSTSTGGEGYEVPGIKQESFQVPAKRTFGSGLAELLASQGLGQKALDVQLKYKDLDQKAKTDAYQHYYDGAAKILAGPNPEEIGSYHDLWSKHPIVGKMIDETGVKGIKHDPRTKATDIKINKVWKPGEINNADGTPFEGGSAKVTMHIDKFGKKTVKDLEPAEEKETSEYTHFLKTQKAAGKTGEEIDAAWDARIRGRKDTSLSDYVKQQDLDRRNREEKEKINERREKNDEQEAKIMKDTSSYENAGYKVVGEEKMKKEAVDQINRLRKNAGKPELEQVPKTVPDESNKNTFGELFGKQPTKTIYEWVPKKSPISGQKTSGLANVPLAVLQAEKQRREGLA